jgi:hypothetical protein
VKLRALRDPHIVEINGRRGRVWTGRNEEGKICRVTIFESGGEYIDIEIEAVELPDLGTSTP